MDSRVRALYKIDAQPEGPAQARRIIAEELSGVLSPHELDDVKLMDSELVTNCGDAMFATAHRNMVRVRPRMMSRPLPT